MRRLKTGFLLATLIVAANASAESTFDPETLGHMKAVLDICGRVDRQAASQYLLQIKAMIGSASKGNVKQAQRRQAYQIAYQTVQSELANRSPQDFDKMCRAYLTEGN